MTGLSPSESRNPQLVSESVLIDGNWHCVTLVCDGSTRALYLDAILVAEDTQTGLASSEGGLHIGDLFLGSPQVRFQSRKIHNL